MKIKTIIIVFVLFLAGIQFYQPSLNIDNNQIYATDFSEIYQPPQEINTILRRSCYDCHSNNSNYFWYNYIQPGRIYVEQHIREGKEVLNFNEWENYSGRKQERLLTSIKNQVADRKMPLSSYTFMHPKARLNDEQTKSILNWIKTLE